SFRNFHLARSLFCPTLWVERDGYWIIHPRLRHSRFTARSIDRTTCRPIWKKQVNTGWYYYFRIIRDYICIGFTTHCNKFCGSIPFTRIRYDTATVGWDRNRSTPPSGSRDGTECIYAIYRIWFGKSYLQWRSSMGNFDGICCAWYRCIIRFSASDSSFSCRSTSCPESLNAHTESSDERLRIEC